MKIVKFKINRPAVRVDILSGNQEMQKLVYSTMEGILSTVKSQFFIEFGFEGKFNLTESVTDRYTTMLRAGDSRTQAALIRQPKWLSQFTDMM